MRKTFVKVKVQHEPDGSLKPLAITWEDGRIFEIDRLLDIRQAASLKSGGTGIRYTVRIRDNKYYLFDDEGKWFIERV